MELSGLWGLGGLPFLDLTFDGRQHVSGTTFWRADGRSAEAPIKNGSFDPHTNALRLEGDAPSLDGEGEAHFVIEGSLGGDAISGTYDYGGLTGCFTFTRLVTP